MSRRLRVAFLMDPIESVIVGHDTTFAFMVECQRRGHEVLSFEQRHLYFRGDRAGARMRSVRVQKVKGAHFDVLSEELAPLSTLDALFLRKDPPVDVEYLHATQFADLTGADARTFVLNDPTGLRDANEKLYALHFPDLVPRTLVSGDLVALREFLDEVGGEMIIKPVDGFAGRGIFHARLGDRNLNSLLEVATRRGQEPVVVQAYLPESRMGDKRVILLDGEPIGAMMRVPQEHDVRGNLAAGGRFEKTTLSERDLEICRRLAPDLRRRGLYFVGIDIIGAYLTEVNVTSPTGVEEIDALEGVSLERQVIDFVDAKVAERRAG
jgi:glutathione synthase